MHHIDKCYIRDYDERYSLYTGESPSVFRNLVGKRFVKDYYRALNEIQEKLYNWTIECWNKVYPGTPYTDIQLSVCHRASLNCSISNRSNNEYTYLSISLDTDYNVKIKNKEYWRVIEGVTTDNDGTRESIGEYLWDIRTYLQK